jgi:glycosyltransferase involved in cell wall biosynthesis
MSPLFRRMAEHPQLDLQVAYCTLRGAEGAHDPDFNVTVKWDVPLLDGYSWQEVPNRGSGRPSFFGQFNPGLWKLIHKGRFDAVVCYTGYVCASFWIACLAVRTTGSVFIFGTDASSLVPRESSSWKLIVKKIFWPRLFRFADQVLTASTAGLEMLRAVGIPQERLTLTPFVVDNDWWMARSQEVDRAAIRNSWQASPDEVVILFCAKLQPWKRPMDLLRAFALLSPEQRLKARLIFAGDGHLRGDLEREAVSQGITDRVRFLGFVNQSQLPAVYTSADLMVLPSEYEPFAVVVNEASCCGCPVAVSDLVGAARDLVVPVNPELVYRCGDVNVLSGILRKCIADEANLAASGRRARERMQTWSPKENIAGLVNAIQRAVSRARRPKNHHAK